MLRLKTLGELTLWRGAAQVTAAGAPPCALPLLAILALAAERAVRPDDAIALLWPDLPRENARREVDLLVAALPGWLEGTQPVQRTDEGLRLDPALISSDVRDFEFAAASGAPDEAARLHEGLFLEGVVPPAKSFDRWREREAARLAQIAKWGRDAVRPRRSKVQLVPGAQVGHGGRYRIERELGTGGAATVYLAHDARHERSVAIKVLREDVSEAISPERFRQEVKYLAQLQHPHILPLFDSGELGPVLYSVMPYVGGDSVRKRLDRDGPLPLDDALRIATDVAEALAYAHERGVLHRDIKPENILLSDGQALVADFGIARSVVPREEGRTTLPGVVLGTLAYMSPEQSSGESELDGRSDVYGVGAVLYEMISGKTPFAGEPPRQLMARRLTEVPPPLSTLGVRVPHEVDAALERALQPAPEGRWTARALADALASARRRLSEGATQVTERQSRARLVGLVTIALAGLVLLFATRCAGAQLVARAAPDTALLARMLVAEDARGLGEEGIAPLLEGLRGGDSVLRRVAVRGLGRLQRPDLIPAIIGALDDLAPAIRAEAANALAQSVASVPRAPNATDSSRIAVGRVRSALGDRIAPESNPAVLGAIARSLGRLPLADSSEARLVERAISDVVMRAGAGRASLDGLSAGTAYGVAHGLYSLARARRTLGEPSPAAIELLRATARYRSDARVRRVGLLGLAAAGAFTREDVIAASRDPDPQVRRLALLGIEAFVTETRSSIVRRLLSDTSAMVRVDAALALARVGAFADCSMLVPATQDPQPRVRLAAIDAFGRAPCGDGAERRSVLQAIAATLSSDARAVARGDWRAPAHAFAALARRDTLAASALLSRFSAHPVPQVREYAVEPAMNVRDTGALFRLAADANHNVQAQAINALARVLAHEADSVYLKALESPGSQVVMAAAAALKGSRDPRAARALLDALDRLSSERRETPREARVRILSALGELRTPEHARRVEPYLADFVGVVALNAADVLEKWMGRRPGIRPVPLPIRPEPLAQIFASRDLRLRITMAPSSGGGSFVVRLFPDEAPATVARVVRLARARYYDGLTFHRFAQNFVIQGGSPDANEYVGDGPFMRDELGLRSHDRGTLGISTRGRDTGDAQIFVNLVDNPRLDHDYTVFGEVIEVIEGMDVVDGILEGDVIVRIEVIAPPPAHPPSG